MNNLLVIENVKPICSKISQIFYGIDYERYDGTDHASFIFMHEIDGKIEKVEVSYYLQSIVIECCSSDHCVDLYYKVKFKIKELNLFYKEE